MQSIILNYLIKNFFNKFFIVLITAYSFALILNLFEEIEFFKNSNASFFTPLFLTSVIIPSLIIKLMPFIIFISSLWFLVKIRNNKELLTLKVYGFSNVKIFIILAFSSFLLGWIILFFINPLSSSLVKYYEKTKSNYARDIDHLVSFNKNGLWIKETFSEGERIITASNFDGYIIKDLEIFEFDNRFSFQKKIFSKFANIQTNDWKLNDVQIINNINGTVEIERNKELFVNSNYNYEQLSSLFNNSDTLSFIEVLINFKEMINKGYNEEFLKENLHSMITLPFYLFVMTAIASILALHTMKNSENFKFIIIGLMLIVLVYYFKDLSLALGKTDRIPLILSIWTPIIALSFFSLIGVIQINEK